MTLEKALAGGDAVGAARVLVERATAQPPLQDGRLPLGTDRERGFIRWTVEAWERHRAGDGAGARGILDALALEEMPRFSHADNAALLALVADVDSARLPGFTHALSELQRHAVAKLLSRRGHLDEALALAAGTGQWRIVLLLEIEDAHPSPALLDEAVRLLEGLSDPQLGFMTILLGRRLALRGDVDGAVALADRLKSCDDSHAGRILSEAAQVVAERGDLLGATSLFARAEERAARSPGTLAEIALRMRTCALEASTLVERALAGAEQDAEQLARVAGELARRGEAERARDLCRQLLTRELSENARYFLIVALDEAGMHAEAERVMPPTFVGTYGILDERVRRGDVAGAIALVKRMPETFDRDCAFEHVAVTLAEAGHVTEALEVAQSYGSSSGARLLLALLARGADDEASRLLAHKAEVRTDQTRLQGLAWIAAACKCAGLVDLRASSVTRIHTQHGHLGALFPLLFHLDWLPQAKDWVSDAILDSPDCDSGSARQAVPGSSADGFNRYLQRLGDANAQMRFLVSIGDVVKSREHLEGAMQRLIDDVSDPRLRFEGLLLAARFRGREALDEARPLLPLAADDAARRLAEAEARCGFLEEAMETAREHGCTISDLDLIEGLTRAGRSSEAMDLAASIDPPMTGSVIRILVDGGRLEEAMKVSVDSTDLMWVSIALARAGDTAQALQAATLIENPEMRLYALAENGDSAAFPALEEALDLVRQSADTSRMVFWLAIACHALATRGKGAEAVHLAESAVPQRPHLLPQVAFALAHAGDRESLKGLLPIAARWPDNCFPLCGALALAWPEQAPAIEELVAEGLR